MSPAHLSSLGIVAYLVLFATVGLLFLGASLLVGRFVRPASPSAVKRATYECGEPAIGSSFIQFDLRFYVVALLFIIFDVEVAFFFPWATVFGKATHLADDRLPVVQRAEDGTIALTREADLLYRELGVRFPAAPQVDKGQDRLHAATALIKGGSKRLAWITIVDIGIFFAVLLVGFAYVWKRGDLEWVRAVAQGDSGDVAEAESVVVVSAP